MATTGPSSPYAPCRSTRTPMGDFSSRWSLRIGSRVPRAVEVSAIATAISASSTSVTPSRATTPRASSRQPSQVRAAAPPARPVSSRSSTSKPASRKRNASPLAQQVDRRIHGGQLQAVGTDQDAEREQQHDLGHQPARHEAGQQRGRDGDERDPEEGGDRRFHGEAFERVAGEGRLAGRVSRDAAPAPAAASAPAAAPRRRGSRPTGRCAAAGRGCPPRARGPGRAGSRRARRGVGVLAVLAGPQRPGQRLERLDDADAGHPGRGRPWCRRRCRAGGR